MIDPKVIQFLQTHKGGVISTLSSENLLDSSFVYFVSNPDGEIYFITSKDTQKFKNIKVNNAVSFVATDTESQITIQARGKARSLTDPEEAKRVYDLLTSILRLKLDNWPPPFAKMENARLVIVKVTFDWIRWGDFNRIQTAPMEDFYEQILPKNEF